VITSDQGLQGDPHQGGRGVFCGKDEHMIKERTDEEKWGKGFLAGGGGKKKQERGVGEI